jgi:hypothetical protein
VALSPVFGRHTNMNFGNSRWPPKLTKPNGSGAAVGLVVASAHQELPMEIRIIADTNTSDNGPTTGTCFF